MTKKLSVGSVCIVFIIFWYYCIQQICVRGTNILLHFTSNQVALFSHFRRVVLGSWKRCVSITSIIIPVHSWSCARATWTQITCRNTSVSSTGTPQVHKTSTQKQQTWPSCMTSDTSQTVITSQWEENLENGNTAVDAPQRSDPVRPQQQQHTWK